jgi:hypothetical protein
VLCSLQDHLRIGAYNIDHPVYCRCKKTDNYKSLNKDYPKDLFLLPRIDQVLDLMAGCELLSFLDAYSGYHQIPLTEVD